MAHRSKSVSLAATILSALLSLRSVSALSNPSHALPRIKRHLAIASSRSSFHRRHTHIPKRCLVSAAAKANDSDSTDSSHHQRLHQRLMDLNFTFAVEDSESLFFEDSESLLFEPSLKKPSVVVAFLSDLSLIYSDLLERRPFITNGITAGVLAAVGDLVAQSESIQMAHDVTAVSVPFNWVRTLTFLLTSLLFEGPWMHAWYESLWKIGCWMETRFQFGPPLQIAAQIFIDQSIGVFLLYPLYFMVYECVGAALSGRVPDLQTVVDACRADFAAILITQYKVWPAVTLANFTLVPEQFRVLVCCIVSLFWNIYLTGTIAGTGKEAVAQAITGM